MQPLAFWDLSLAVSIRVFVSSTIALVRYNVISGFCGRPMHILLIGALKKHQVGPENTNPHAPRMKCLDTFKSFTIKINRSYRQICQSHGASG